MANETISDDTTPDERFSLLLNELARRAGMTPLQFLQSAHALKGVEREPTDEELERMAEEWEGADE